MKKITLKQAVELYDIIKNTEGVQGIYLVDGDVCVGYSNHTYGTPEWLYNGKYDRQLKDDDFCNELIQFNKKEGSKYLYEAINDEIEYLQEIENNK